MKIISGVSITITTAIKLALRKGINESTYDVSLASPFLFGDLDLLPRLGGGEPRRGGVPPRSR